MQGFPKFRNVFGVAMGFRNSRTFWLVKSFEIRKRLIGVAMGFRNSETSWHCYIWGSKVVRRSGVVRRFRNSETSWRYCGVPRKHLGVVTRF